MNDVVEALVRLLGPEGVRAAAGDLDWAAGDATGHYRLPELPRRAVRPLAVAAPRDLAGVQAVIRWAAERRVPVVARGAGTGVMGGAVPAARAVVLDLTRLDDIIVHPDDFLVEAGAGALLGGVNAALAPHGLMLGHDPWSVAIATVGGAISTDGMGYLAGRWGSAGQQVAGIEAVLADGSVVRTRTVRPVIGPDWRCLLVGSQGTLAVITRAWLRAVPLPEAEAFGSFGFSGFDAAYRALLALWRTGLRYDLLDLTDGPVDALGLPPAGRGAVAGTGGRAAVLHLGAFGPSEDAEARLTVARRVLGAHGAHHLGADPARLFWKARHAVAERYAREVQEPRDAKARAATTHGFEYLNLALPPSRVITFRRRALELLAGEDGVVVGETGIWCTPEIFSLGFGERPGAPVEPERRRRIMDGLLRLALDHGGNIETIHGPGLKLRHLIAEELAGSWPATARVKRALDPLSLLNPGKLPS